MLVENTLFGTVDKVAEAIEMLQTHEPSEGYYVAFSGGKDSVVVLDLVKRSGVKYKAYHNIVTIEPPDLMKFIYKEYPEVEMVHTKETMYSLIVKNGMPPLRHVRYCHRLLKRGGEVGVKVTGVRAEESVRRSKKQKWELNHKGTGYLLNIIFDWTTQEVWEYIHTYNIKYCKLYDEGKTRIGCLFCPFGRQEQMEDDLRRYPQVAKYLITACDRAIKNKRLRGKDINFRDGEDMFYWWINHSRHKKDAMQDLPGLFESEDD